MRVRELWMCNIVKTKWASGELPQACCLSAPEIARIRTLTPSIRAYHMALSRFFAVAAACIVLVAPPVLADEVQEINQQFRSGNLTGALTRANAYLAENPKDAQTRFLKGLILADQGKTNDAIAVFTGLTEDYPELPEPYNNLAVLYASQNKYAAAKNALEMAIRTHPSYATAHENLGDIYAKMASIAYDKALALDSKNTAAQTKLALIQDLIGGQPSKPATSKVIPVAPRSVAADPSPVKPSPVKPAATNKDVEAAVTRWAQAWSARDIDTYLAAYASNFTTDGLTHAEWEAQRRARITAAALINVKISNLKIEQQGDTASATFNQSYRSDRHQSTVKKTLKLALQNGQWRIVGETSN
ncbi:MAG: tetratricopeptide repeat protein [Thiobacillus sp.]|nr:tetratricopeptide repeat protein [Thiobacillus sp.]